MLIIRDGGAPSPVSDGYPVSSTPPTSPAPAQVMAGTNTSEVTVGVDFALEPC